MVAIPPVFKVGCLWNRVSVFPGGWEDTISCDYSLLQIPGTMPSVCRPPTLAKKGRVPECRFVRGWQIDSAIPIIKKKD